MAIILDNLFDFPVSSKRKYIYILYSFIALSITRYFFVGYLSEMPP